MARLPARIARLGRVDYVATASLQRSLRAARAAGAVPDLLLMLEHDPVITCGRVTEASEIEYARTTHIPLVAVERGGKATYHGPHQVVAYPIMSLELVGGDVKLLVHRLEQAVIDALAAHGVECSRHDGYPGVWVDVDTPRPRKIASLGLRLSGGVTFHGVAVNICNDLTPFAWFTPCGIADAEMTSLARELGSQRAAAPSAPQADAGDTDALVTSFAAAFEANILREFGLEATAISTGELHEIAARYPVDEPHLSLPDAPRARQAQRIALTPSEAV